MADEKNINTSESGTGEKINDPLLEIAEMEYNRTAAGETQPDSEAAENAVITTEEMPYATKAANASIADKYVLSVVFGFIAGIIIGAIVGNIAAVMVAGILIGCAVGAYLVMREQEMGMFSPAAKEKREEAKNAKIRKKREKETKE